VTSTLSDELNSIPGGINLRIAKNKRKPVKPRVKSAIGGWLNKLKADNCPIQESVRHDFMQNLVRQDNLWSQQKLSPLSFS
jgi:hypothetical protein